MLNENIRALRRSKGLSQEELAVKINVVRQTISKWEQGLSVPDADLLIALSEALETPVSALLGETLAETAPDDLRAVAEKLEVVNRQLARRRALARKAVWWLMIALCAGIAGAFAALVALNGAYLGWDCGSPETAVAVAALHAFEWVFVRIAPIALGVLLAAIVGMSLARSKA